MEVMKIGNELHEEKIEETSKEYESLGYKVINLKGRSPDLIAFKNGKAICIEVLAKRYSKKKYSWVSNWTYKSKQQAYSNMGFDRIEIIDYKLPK